MGIYNIKELDEKNGEVIHLDAFHTMKMYEKDDGGKELFKPARTPNIAISEVFWSQLLKKIGFKTNGSTFATEGVCKNYRSERVPITEN
ncbi:hypothetical protein FACS1894156_5850 [Bacteroidia bacterium]|nr:hypothetical protein FACS1894156_5850 [Bacteroidia bacterium]